MTDRELDDLLDAWVAPPTTRRLGERVREGFVFPPVRRPRRQVWWIAFGLAACLAMVALAFPQIVLPVVGPRFTVDSEVVSYAADGSSRVERYTTSFQQGGRVAQLTTSAPGQSFTTALRWIISDAVVVVVRGVGEFFEDKSKRAREDWCRALPGLKKETLLGYETVIIPWQPRGNNRLTEWRAPDSGCVPLKTVTEVQGEDGRFRVTSESRPVRVSRR